MKLRRLALAPAQRGIEARLALARQQQLEAMVAGVGDPVNADQRAAPPPPAVPRPQPTSP